MSKPKVNQLSRFSTLLFFKDGNITNPLAPLPVGGGRDRHMPSQTFLYEIQFRTTLI